VPVSIGRSAPVQAGDRVTKGTVLAQVREIDYIVKVHEAKDATAGDQDARSQGRSATRRSAGDGARAAGPAAGGIQASFEIARQDFEALQQTVCHPRPDHGGF